jgi:hypothetical protein
MQDRLSVIRWKKTASPELGVHLPQRRKSK